MRTETVLQEIEVLRKFVRISRRVKDHQDFNNLVTNPINDSVSATNEFTVVAGLYFWHHTT